MGVAEFENTLAEYHRAGGIRATDQEMKDDLLHILPAELRDALVWNSRDGGSFHAFRDMVTTQAAKVLMNRHKLPIHNVDGEEHKETAGVLAGGARGGFPADTRRQRWWQGQEQRERQGQGC